MPYAETEAGRLFYTETPGPSETPALVLIHGAGGSRLHWPSELRRMKGATVYTLDLPGHGRSDDMGCETILAHARVVATFLECVVARSATIVGHSMGGAIAQTLAIRGETHASALVLIGTGARLRVAPAILHAIGEDFESAVDLVTDYAWSPGAAPALKELGREALRETGPDVLLRDFRACDGFDVIGRLEEIRVPALVIVGCEDRLTPVKYSRFLTERLRDARMVTIDRAGHMVMLEQPVRMAEAVRGFLAAD